MLEEIPAHAWWEWLAFAQLEPFGQLQEDVRAGQVAAVTANVNRGRKKKQTAWEPEDFFPALKAPRQRKTVPDMIRAAEAITAAFGGDDLRKNKGRPQ